MPSKRILVVDDDDTIRVVLAQICRRAGYEVVSASDGVEAVRLLESTDFDLVTMDLMMPHMDGVDAASIIRTHSDAPIIAISAHVTPAIRRDLAGRGITAILEKPFGQEDVMTRIAEAIDGSA